MSKSKSTFAFGLALGSVAFGLICLGTCIGVIWAKSYSNGSSTVVETTPVIFSPDSAARTKSMSMATGIISDDVEGLFVLDHENGDLNCMILNPVNPKTGGLFKTNVFTDMSISKDSGADLVIVTGAINVRGTKGNKVPARCVCYVGDAASGKVVGYSLFYDRTVANKGGAQTGALKVVFAGKTRGEVIDRQ